MNMSADSHQPCGTDRSRDEEKRGEERGEREGGNTTHEQRERNKQAHASIKYINTGPHSSTHHTGGLPHDTHTTTRHDQTTHTTRELASNKHARQGNAEDGNDTGQTIKRQTQRQTHTPHQHEWRAKQGGTDDG